MEIPQGVRLRGVTESGETTHQNSKVQHMKFQNYSGRHDLDDGWEKNKEYLLNKVY